jgi:hypothetical protein
MKNRWFTRVLGGMTALLVSAVMIIALAHPGIVSGQTNAGCSLDKTRTQASGTCDCSKCRSDQYCCPTANGYCGCFPMPCP